MQSVFLRRHAAVSKRFSGIALSVALGASALAISPMAAQAQSKTVPATGVAIEGPSSARWSTDYDLFLKMPGYSLTEAQVDAKLTTAWKQFSNQLNPGAGYAPIKLDAGDSSMAYSDVNVASPNNTWDGGPRACTEGQGWAMMLAVQMNDQPMFDKLWKFTKTYLQYRSVNPSTDRGYLFCWECLPQPTGGVHYKNNNDINQDGVAPDGDQWISASLLCAAGRWGSNSTGIDYQTEANNILGSFLHIEAQNGYTKDPTTGLFNNPNSVDITNCFQNNQVVYQPGDWNVGPQNIPIWQTSDPSYCLPAFYQLFATVGPQADQATWQGIADYARGSFFPKATGQISSPPNGNASTAIAPYITTLDGTGYDGAGTGSGESENGDGIRVPSNIGVDYMWWASTSDSRFSFHQQYGNTFTTFYTNFGGGGFFSGSWPYDYNRYWYPGSLNCNGTGSGNHNEASTGMNAVSAQVSTNATSFNLVQELWNCHQPIYTGNQATQTWGEPYWDGNLYMLGLLESSGNFRAYGVGAAAAPITVPAAHGGSWMAQLNTTTGSTWHNLYQYLNVSANTSYTVSCYVYGNGAVVPVVRAGNWGTEISRATFSNTGNSWQYCSFTINSGSNSQLTLDIQDGGGAPCTVFVDDVSVAPTSGGSNVVANPGFEDGNGNTVWNIEEPFSFVEESGLPTAHSGSWMGQLNEATTGTWHNFYQTAGVYANTNYNVGCWLYGVGSLACTVRAGSWGNVITQQTFTGTSNSWNWFQTTFNTGSNTQATIDFQDGGTATATTLYFDDLGLTPSAGGNNAFADADLEQGTTQTSWGFDGPFSIVDPPSKKATVRTLEGETQTWTSSSGGSVAPVTEVGASGGVWEKCTTTGSGKYFQFTASVPVAGKYAVTLKTKKYKPNGIIQLTIDGTNQGASQDLYAGNVQWVGINLGTRIFSAGNHTITLNVTGKNANSTGYTVPVDAVILTPQ